MKKTIWPVWLVLLPALIITNVNLVGVVMAQDSPLLVDQVLEPILIMDEIQPPGLLPGAPPSENADRCFEYYPYGQIGFSANTNKGYYKPGETVTVSGQAINRSNTLVVDASVLVQLNYAVLDEEGNVVSSHLLDSEIVLEDLSIPANGNTEITYRYKLPSWLPAGTYTLAVFMIASDQYNLAGLSFIPNVYGDLLLFGVGSSRSFDLPYFDITRATVGDIVYSRNLPAISIANSPVMVRMPLISASSGSVKVVKQLYHWDDTATKNFIKEEAEVVNFKSSDQQLITFQTPKLEGGTYMVTFTAIDDSGAQTISRIRFSLPGGRLRLIYSGLSHVPASSNEKAEVITCFADETFLSSSGDNTIRVSLLDKTGKSLITSDQKIVDFPSSVQSQINVFEYNTDKRQDLTLVTQLYRGDKLLDEVRTVYPGPKSYTIFIVIGAILTLIIGSYLIYHRHWNGLPTLLILVLISLFIGFQSQSQTNPTTNIDDFNFNAYIQFARVNLRVHNTISLQTPTSEWQPGGVYALTKVQAAEYYSQGGSFDSPPLTINATNLYARDPLRVAFAQGSQEGAAGIVFSRIRETSSTWSECAQERNAFNWLCMGWANIPGYRAPLLASGNVYSNDPDDNNIAYFPGPVWTTNDNFYLEISIPKRDELISSNPGIICNSTTFRCTVRGDAQPDPTSITWRRILGESSLGIHKIQYYSNGYWTLQSGPVLQDSRSLSHSVTVNVTAEALPVPPGTPTNLRLINTAPLAPCGGSIYLLWMPPMTGGVIEGYKVFRDDNPNDGIPNYIQIATTTQTNYRDSGLVPNSTHSYFVKAYNAFGESNPSNTVSIAASDVCPPLNGVGGTPPPPDGGQVTTSTAPEVTLCESIRIDWPAATESNWPAATGDDVSYDIRRMVQDIPGWNPLFTDETIWTINNYTDRDLDSTASYMYDVTAYTSAGDSLDYTETPDWTTPSSCSDSDNGNGVDPRPTDGPTPEPDRDEIPPSLNLLPSPSTNYSYTPGLFLALLLSIFQ